MDGRRPSHGRGAHGARGAAVLAAAWLLAACSQSPSATTPPSALPAAASPSALTAVATSTIGPETTAAPGPTAVGGCVLQGEPSDGIPLPSARCSVADFTPAMSFEAIEGWRWAGNADRWVMFRIDEGPQGEIWRGIIVRRYGGAVVPAYCEDPATLVPTTEASAIVAWLDTVEGLDANVVGRSVGANPAWQLDLRVQGAPSCSPGKDGLASLWTLDGEPVELPQTIGEGESLRVYMIELDTAIVIVTVDSGDLADPSPFLAEAEGVFSSLSFD